MALTSEQINAMAKEIVQHVKGDAERAEQERQARAKGGEEAKREARLVGEVAAKLKQVLADAVEPDEGTEPQAGQEPAPASAPAPTTGSSQHGSTRRT